jgi:hypothetical protein
MKVIYDDESGDVMVVLRDHSPAHATHQYSKFGVTMYWDGHAGLLGIGFSQGVKTSPEFYRIGTGDRLPLRDYQLIETGKR